MTHSRASASGPFPGRVDSVRDSSFYVLEQQIDHGAWTPALAPRVTRARLIVQALLSLTIGTMAHAETPASQGNHVVSNALNGTVVTYDAPAGCPSQSDFEARLRARSGNHGTGSAAPPPLRRVEARIQVSGKRAQGMVVITDAAGVATTRRIAAASCTEAVDALALIVALTLDPLVAGESGPVPSAANASREEGNASSAAGSSESQKAGSAAAAATPAARPAGEKDSPADEPSSDKAQSSEPATERDSAPSPANANAPHAGRFGAFVSALVASGATPDPAFGGQLGLDAVLLEGTPRLSLVVGARIVVSQSVSSSSGTASFDWWAGFAAMCAGAHIGSSSVSLDLCGTFELGRLAAAGSNTRNPASAEGSWQALGPALNAEWLVAPSVGLTAGVEGLFPFRRQRFFIGEDVVHQIPPITLRAQAGAAVHF